MKIIIVISLKNYYLGLVFKADNQEKNTIFLT